MSVLLDFVGFLFTVYALSASALLAGMILSGLVIGIAGMIPIK